MALGIRQVEAYLQGLAQTHTNAVNDPYTTGRVALTPAQLAANMRRLGYTQAQINAALTGRLPGSGSGIGGTLQGIAGATAALGPEAAPLSSAAGSLGDLLGAGSDAASAASDLPGNSSAAAYAPDTQTAADTTTSDPTAANSPSLAARTLPSASTLFANDLSQILGDLKYGAIWVGLMLLGLGLIFAGLTRNGVKPPTVLLA